MLCFLRLGVLIFRVWALPFAWGSPEFLSAFVGSVVDHESALQERLRDLGDPQVELHLLRSCLGVCKLNHLLRTIPPGCGVDSELLRFDDNLPVRHSLSSICNASISDQSWPVASGYLALFPWWLGTTWGSSCLFSCLFRLLYQLFCPLFPALIYLFWVRLPSPYLPSQGKSLLFLAGLSALLSGTPIMEVPASQFSEAQRPALSVSAGRILVNPVLCCHLVHYETRLGFVPSLHILVSVHGLGPFLQFL